MSEALAVFEWIVRAARNVGQSSLGERRDIHPFDERNIHPDIGRISLKLFDDGHYAQSTFEAFKYIDNQVKSISGIEDTGFNLMMQVFDDKAPRIRLTDLQSTSDKDEQRGFRHVFAGVMSGIRNPRGHDNRVDPIDLCLDHLSVASVLLRTLEARRAP